MEQKASNLLNIQILNIQETIYLYYNYIPILNSIQVIYNKQFIIFHIYLYFIMTDQNQLF